MIRVSSPITYKYNIRELVSRKYIFKYNILRNKFEHLKKIKTEEVNSNRDIILEAVRIIKAPSTNEILNYIVEQSEQCNQTIKAEAKKKYENGSFTDSDKRKYIEKESMIPINIRTIQRGVKRLTKEGLLEYKSGKYYLTEKANTEARYFPELLGETLLHSICSFELRSQQENIQELVKRFGAMIIFIFIEALLTKDTSSDIHIRPQINWIKDTVPVSKMFEHFLNMIVTPKTSNRLESMGLKSNEKTVEETMQNFKNLYPEFHALLDRSKQSIQTKLPI